MDDIARNKVKLLLSDIWGSKFSDSDSYLLERHYRNKPYEAVINAISGVRDSHEYQTYPHSKLCKAISAIPDPEPDRMHVYALWPDGKFLDCFVNATSPEHAENAFKLWLRSPVKDVSQSPQELFKLSDEYVIYVNNFKLFLKHRADIYNQKARDKKPIRGLDVDVSKVTGSSGYLMPTECKKVKETLTDVFNKDISVTEEERLRLTVLSERKLNDRKGCYTEWESDFINEINKRHNLLSQEMKGEDAVEIPNGTKISDDLTEQGGGSLSPPISKNQALADRIAAGQSELYGRTD